MPTPLPAVVVFVADVARLTTFYRELAQMTLVHAAPDHAVLEIDGLQLVIHGLPPGVADVPTPGQALYVREDSYVKLCLPVRSIASARAMAASLGGAIRPETQEWEARGFRACDGYDPEGNVIQVRVAAD